MAMSLHQVIIVSFIEYENGFFTKYFFLLIDFERAGGRERERGRERNINLLFLTGDLTCKLGIWG